MHHARRLVTGGVVTVTLASRQVEAFTAEEKTWFETFNKKVNTKQVALSAQVCALDGERER